MVRAHAARYLGGFAAAYGDSEVLAAYDRMMINLPTSTGNEHTLRTAETQYEHGKLNAAGLHRHWNQDGYEDTHPGQLICCASPSTLGSLLGRVAASDKLVAQMPSSPSTT